MLLNHAKYEARLRLANFAVPYEEEKRIADLTRQLKKIKGSSPESKAKREELREQMKGAGKITPRPPDATGKPSSTERGVYPMKAAETALRRDRARDYYLDLDSNYTPDITRKQVFDTARTEIGQSKDIRKAMNVLSDPNADPKAYQEAYNLLSSEEGATRVKRLGNQAKQLDDITRTAGNKRAILESGNAPEQMVKEAKKVTVTRGGKAQPYAPAIKGDNTALRRVSERAKNFDISQYPAPSQKPIDIPAPESSPPPKTTKATKSKKPVSFPADTADNIAVQEIEENARAAREAANSVASDVSGPVKKGKVSGKVKRQLRLPNFKGVGMPATIGAGALAAGSLGLLGINAYQAAQRNKQREDELRQQLYERYM